MKTSKAMLTSTEEMSDKELRLECLSMALDSMGGDVSAQDVLTTASAFFDFVSIGRVAEDAAHGEDEVSSERTAFDS